MNQNNRAPLYDADAEQAVLGSVLINPDFHGEVTQHITGADFYLVKNRWVWDVVNTIVTDGRPLDILTVSSELEARKQLNEIGGVAYLTQLINAVPTSLHAEAYAVIVRKNSIRRAILEKATELAKIAYAKDEPFPAAYAITAAIDNLRASKAGFVSAYDAAEEWVEELARWVETKKIPGLTTGFRLIDAKTHGFQRQKMIVIAARPSEGKSALMAQCFTGQVKAGLRVAIFSLEMPVRQLLGRAALSALNLNYRTITKTELQTITDWMNDFSKLPNMRFYDRGNIPPEEVAHVAHRAAKEMGGLDCVWIDHLSYIAYPDRGSASYSIGRGLKYFTQLAKDENCAVVALSQLSRDTARANREPELHDLRESGEIEQDARMVWMIHRPNKSTDLAALGQPEDAAILVRKNDDGPTGKISMKFIPQSAKWVEVDTARGTH